MKFIFRTIGFIVVVLIILMLVLCYLDAKGLLTGDLGGLVGSLRVLGKQAWAQLRQFFSTSGIGDDAAGLLEQGAEYLRSTPTASQVPTATPGWENNVPTATPEVIIIQTP